MISRKTGTVVLAGAVMIVIGVIFAAIPVVSALIIKTSVEDLTREADVIVIGNVNEVASRWNFWRATIYTYSTLSVEKYIKGTGHETLIIITKGGTVGDLNMWVEDVPVFEENETVLVFLKQAGDEFSVVGWVQGKYVVENETVRDLSDEKTPLKDFLRRIEDAIPLQDAQGQDSGGKPALDNKDPLLYDAQMYASNNNVSTEEALRRFQLQDIAGKLNAELSKNETGTFAGLWIEHKPKFKIVVLFIRDSEETIKPYLKQYTELADIVEVRTANVSLANLQRDQADASSAANALGIRVPSSINVYNNSVELYITKADRSRFDDALQRGEIRLPDTVRVITVEAEQMPVEVEQMGTDIPHLTPTAQATPGAPGFDIVFGVTGVLAVWWRLKK